MVVSRRRTSTTDRPCALRVRSIALALLVLLALASCRSTYRPRDWSDYHGPGAEHFQKEELPFPHVDDPLEPANRVSSAFDFTLKRCVIGPVAWFYRLFVPEEARDHLKLAGVHWAWPVRVVNNLLQGKWSWAKEETLRFAVNSTVGLLGLFDPATEWGLRAHDEDFGQTFAKWGWKNSTYLYVPILGPSTVRDGIGEAADAYTDPVNLDLRLASARALNAASDSIDPTVRLVLASYDAYEPARTLFMLNRELDVTNFAWKSDQSAATQTLEAIFLAPEDRTFPERGRTERVTIVRGRELPYTIWLQPGAAPLYFVVPGFAGHRLSDSALALAEMLYATGCSVVTVSNPTNWEFIRNAASAEPPGYAPVDALDLHHALTAIDRAIEARDPGRVTSRRIAGISMGALDALHLAANEERADAQGLVQLDLYVALDPPVSLEHALTQLDRFYNVPLSFPAEERQARIDEIFAKALYLGGGSLTSPRELPFTQLEAQFLIGLAFRLDLQYTILQTQDLHDRGVLRTKRSWFRRADAFREASEYSFLEYMYAFLLPSYAERDPTITLDEAGARRLFDTSDLRAIGDRLAANPRLRVFANENDFVLRPEDVEWLRTTLGTRAHLFPGGGHLGNLHRKGIQSAIQEIVAEAARENGQSR